MLPSVLWRCQLGGRKGIWPVKNWVMGVLAWLSVLSDVKTCIWPSWCHCDWYTLNTLTKYIATHTHTHPFNGPLSGTTQVGWYQKGKTNLDFTKARDNEWQWHQLGHMQVCTLLQTDNHASTPRLSFSQAGCPSCRPTNSVKTLKAKAYM